MEEVLGRGGPREGLGTGARCQRRERVAARRARDRIARSPGLGPPEGWSSDRGGGVWAEGAGGRGPGRGGARGRDVRGRGAQGSRAVPGGGGGGWRGEGGGRRGGLATPLGPGPGGRRRRAAGPGARGRRGRGDRVRGPVRARRPLPWASPRTWLRAAGGGAAGSAERLTHALGPPLSRRSCSRGRALPPNPRAQVGRRGSRGGARVHEARSRASGACPAGRGSWRFQMRQPAGPARSGVRTSRGTLGAGGAQGS